MIYKRFNVVELKNGNKATILDIKNKQYYAEIVDSDGKRIEIRHIEETEISKKLYPKNK